MLTLIINVYQLNYIFTLIINVYQLNYMLTLIINVYQLNYIFTLIINVYQLNYIFTLIINVYQLNYMFTLMYTSSTICSQNYQPAKLNVHSIFHISNKPAFFKKAQIYLRVTFFKFSSSLVLASSISATRFWMLTSTVSHCSRMSRDVSSRMLSSSVRSWMEAMRSCSARQMLSWLNCCHDSGVD